MKRGIKVAALAILALVGIVLAAIPLVVPPIVERVAVEKLAEYGVDASVSFKLWYCWRNGPGVSGRFVVMASGSPWRVVADFGASCCEWSVKVSVPETEFDERDPLLQSQLARSSMPAVSNLIFSGKVALNAKAERTFSKPVAEWSVSVPVKDFRASMTMNDKPFAASGVTATPSAYGIADHYDINPIRLRVASLEGAGVVITNLRATIRATEKALMISEMTAGCCGGTISAYSVFLDPKRLNAGFTVFMDNVEAGDIFRSINGFDGEVSGKLHGKFRAFLKEGGKSVRMGDMFLYSTPGETGKLMMRDASVVTDNLAYAGIGEAERDNVADALGNLDYKVLRFDLKRFDDENARLSIRIGGTATRGKVSAPVDITVNVNGKLEQLINVGLGYTAKLKGKEKK